MNEQNVQVVQQIYTAFGQGDIQTILLNLITADPDWFFPGPADIPFSGHYRSREQVGRFFTLIAEAVEIELFEPLEFIAQGDKVVVLGHERARAKSTGRLWETDWVHVWTLQQGKVARLREYTDTAALAAAFGG